MASTLALFFGFLLGNQRFLPRFFGLAGLARQGFLDGLADLLLQPGENFHGQLMVDYWHASGKPVAMTPAPSGMG